MEEITCNINDFVFVRLNERGLKILKNDFKGWTPKQDEEGWTKFQLWELMEIFGDYMFLGSETPFETTIKIKQA